MKWRTGCLMLCLMVVLPLGSKALAAEAATDEKVTNLSTQVVLDDVQAAEIGREHAASLPSGPLYLVDGELVGDENLTVYHETTYVSLPEFVLALQPDASVCWDGSQVVVQASGLTMTAKPGNCYIEANGRALHVPDGVLSLNSSTLVPIRTAAQAMGASVDWDQENSMISVHSGTGAITPAESYYDSDDLYWLSHIINAESGGEPLEGKLAVGTVSLNRVSSPRFQNTIYGVVFAPNQFTPASTGAIYREPNAESVLAAKLCLEGVRVGGESLYFVNPTRAPNSWAARNRPYVTTIGHHSFYA